MANIANTEMYIDGDKEDLVALSNYIDSCHIYIQGGHSLEDRLGVPPSADRHNTGGVVDIDYAELVDPSCAEPSCISLVMASKWDESVWMFYALAYEFNCVPCFFCEESGTGYYISDDMASKHISETHYMSAYIDDEDVENFSKILQDALGFWDKLDDYKDSRIEIEDIDEYVRKDFRVDSYDELQQYMEKYCPNSYFCLNEIQFIDKYADMRAHGRLLYEIKHKAAEHGIAITDLYKLRDHVWSMNGEQVIEVQAHIKAGDKREVQELLLKLGLG